MNNDNKKQQKRQHAGDCCCRKCVYADIDKWMEDGLLIEDSKGILYSTTDEGLAAYHKANPSEIR